MNNTLVGIFFGVGLGGWVYYQLMRRTGGNTKSAVISAVLAGLVGFFVIYTLFTMIFPSDPTTSL